MTDKTFGYTLKGSPAHSGEDDNWTGEDGFPSLEKAKEAAAKCAEEPFMKRGAGALYVVIHSPTGNTVKGLEEVEVVESYLYRKADLKRLRQEEAMERNEMAMQHGMAFGCEGYNQFYGELTEPEPEIIRGFGPVPDSEGPGSDGPLSWGKGEISYAEEKAYDMGHTACAQGLPKEDNPFSGELFDLWNEGWDEYAEGGCPPDPQ